MCELDILYRADQVHLVIDEMLSSEGAVINANKAIVVDSVRSFIADEERAEQYSFFGET